MDNPESQSRRDDVAGASPKPEQPSAAAEAGEANGAPNQPKIEASAESMPAEGGEVGTAITPVAASFHSESEWDVTTKRTVLVMLFVLGVIVLWISRPVLPILIIAGIISYLISPIVDLLERIRVPRGLSTVIIYLLFLVLLILAPILLIPVLIDQLSSLAFDVPSTARTFARVIQGFVTSLPTTVDFLGFDLPMGHLVEQLRAAVSGEVAIQFLPTAQDILNYLNQLISTATNVVGSTALIGVTVVGGIFNLFLFLIFLFFLSLYLTKDAPMIRDYVEGLFPQSYHSEGVALMRQVGNIWHAFFRGQIILSVTIGFVTWVILTLLGMPGALILAILAGMLEVIPNIGPILAMIPAVIVALIQGSDVLVHISNLNFALIVIGAYFVVQQLENQLLVPRIIGTSVNLHPVIVLCGVVVGASVGGILGAFLAAPVIASLRVVGSYVHAKLLGYPPFTRDQLSPPRRRRKPFVYRRVVRPQEITKAEEGSSATDEADSVPAASQQGNKLGRSPAG